MYNILLQGENVTVAIEDTAREYKPVVMMGGVSYNPRNAFWAMNRGKGQLDPMYVPEAEELIEKAQAHWSPKKKSGSTPADMINNLLVDTVAQLAAKDVVEVAKPLLDDFIMETYGKLPQRLEVVTEKKTNVVQGITHEKFETVLQLVNCNIPVFLTGPAGCGKNVLCKQVSEALGIEFYFSNAVTQEYKLTGFIDANGRFHETQFYKAFTEGGLFMLDEIDASTPEVLVILNAAIANGYFDFPTGRAEAHEDFRLIAAAIRSAPARILSTQAAISLTPPAWTGSRLSRLTTRRRSKKRLRAATRICCNLSGASARLSKRRKSSLSFPTALSSASTNWRTFWKRARRSKSACSEAWTRTT